MIMVGCGGGGETQAVIDIGGRASMEEMEVDRQWAENKDKMEEVGRWLGKGWSE